jgi:hypothetical protein
MARSLIVVLVGVLAIAGCTRAGLPGPSAPAGSPAAPAVPAASDPGTGPTPSPTVAAVDPSLAVPPAARLGDGAAGAPRMDGALASWTWDGAGDQAPWFVPADRVATTTGTPLVVTLDPGGEPTAWSARWAPVAGGQPGDVATTAEGAEAPVTLTAPAAPGSWTLLLEASFGEGRSAAWTWAVDVRE